MFNLITTVFAEGEQVAQVAENTTETTGGLASQLLSLAPIIILFVLMYFMLIRPQKKQQKQMQKMLSSLEVGDKVVTIGGICGRISKIKDEFVWVSTGKVSDDAAKSSIKLERGAIKSVDKKIEE